VCIWVVSSSYGASGAGQFAQIQRLVGAPLMLAGMSIGQVLLRHSADVMHDPPMLNELFSRLLKAMGMLGLAVVFVIAVAGEPVLRWVLGPQWRADFLFITPISLAVAVRACASPLSTILVTLRRFDLTLRWQAAYFASASILFWLATSHLRIEGFVIFYAVHECLFYAAYLLIIHSAVRSWSCAASSA
jgi:O-antigen/teichoic acid export membrane protein